MKKIALTCQRDLADFMLKSNQFRLSRQDRNFIQGITNLLYTNQPVTTNQVWLMNNLIDKYNKQLSKHIDTSQLKNLPWVSKIIMSDVKYTDSYIDIAEGKIFFRSPYNNKFITNLRNAAGNELFVWEKSEKRYVANYCSSSFKLIVTLAFSHFKTIHCCETTIKLLNQLSIYESVKHWNPTLINVNGRPLIVANNNHVNEYLEKINFDYQITPKNLAILSRMKVDIDQSITLDNSDLLFASQFNTTIELKDLDKLPRLLKLIGCDLVYTYYDNFYAQQRSNLRSKLLDEGIRLVSDQWFMNKCEFPVILKFRQLNTLEHKHRLIGKIINVVNREPIDIK
jgi:hypothetical protein